MPSNLASFALHVAALARARAFYEAVFEWEFEPWGPPGFYLIHTGDEKSPGIQGLLPARHASSTGTGLSGFDVTFSDDDLDAIIARVEEPGGRIPYPKSPIPTVGTI